MNPRRRRKRHLPRKPVRLFAARAALAGAGADGPGRVGAVWPPAVRAGGFCGRSERPWLCQLEDYGRIARGRRMSAPWS